jgi:hypothetical protein
MGDGWCTTWCRGMTAARMARAPHYFQPNQRMLSGVFFKKSHACASPDPRQADDWIACFKNERLAAAKKYLACRAHSTAWLPPEVPGPLVPGPEETSGSPEALQQSFNQIEALQQWTRSLAYLQVALLHQAPGADINAPWAAGFPDLALTSCIGCHSRATQYTCCRRASPSHRRRT